MSIKDSILLALNLKEENLQFNENHVSKVSIKGVDTLVYEATLTYSADHCTKCGCTKENIIKYGTKTSRITLPRVSKLSCKLSLRKQRFMCKSCHHTFTAETSIVKKNCFISNNTYHSCILESKTKMSVKDISKANDVSFSSLNKWLHKLYDSFTVSKNYLPKHLSFDEFKSVKSADSAMSFLFIDTQSHKLIDIVMDRKLNTLVQYFKSYSDEARANVETITIDMYAPYISLVKSCFPNATIIFDRFHIVQLISRSLNKTRIQAMNRNKKHYNKLKRYWRLLLKKRSDLKSVELKKYTCFKQSMNEDLIVDYLLNCDDELAETYWIYQDLLSAIHNKDSKRFKELIESPDTNISNYMKTSIETYKKYTTYITNSFKYEYSNGPIEGLNNLIKVTKRIAFGYRNYINFKIRILLITNRMVKLGY